MNSTVGAAVRTDQTDARTGFEFETEVVDDLPAPEGERDVFELDRLVAEPGGRRNQQLHVGIPDRTGTGGDLVEPLHSAEIPFQPRLGGAAHPFDFGAQKAPAFLFGDVLARLPLGLGGEKVGVTALIAVELPVGKLHDPGGNPVKKTAVVGDEKTAAAVIGEEVFDPLHRADVEMVGRLVEQQQVGFGHDRPRQRNPALFAAGEGAAEPVPVGETEFFQHEIELVVEVPAVVQHQLMVDGGVFGRVDRKGFKFVLEFPEPGEPLRDIFRNRAVAVEPELLRKERHPQLPRPGDRTAAGKLLAGDQTEQRGLAAAVPADQPDPFPAGNGKFRVVVKCLPPDGERQLFRGPEYIVSHSVSRRFYAAPQLSWRSVSALR